ERQRLEGALADDPRSRPPLGEPVAQAGSIGPGRELLGREDLDDLDAGIERPAELADPVDEREAAPVALASVAEAGRGTDPGVGAARQDRAMHRAMMRDPRLVADSGGHPVHRANAPRVRRAP